jgi:RNA polymerase sigma factor for flagellar operon FliA
MVAATVRDVGALWVDYARTRSEKLRNLLMEHYLPLVQRIAQRIHTKLPKEVELDDLVSAGTFGLMDAIHAFDPGRAVKFETYCGNRIRGAILDELRSWDWVPRLARLRAARLTAAARELKLELGRDATEDELAMRLRCSRTELERITRDGNVVRVMPFSRRVSQDDEAESDADVLEDRRAVERTRGLEQEDVRAMLTRGLSRAEQLIVILYYFEEMTMKEIGATLDLSESRVSQMHSTILARLQGQLAGRRRELEAVAV